MSCSEVNYKEYYKVKLNKLFDEFNNNTNNIISMLKDVDKDKYMCRYEGLDKNNIFDVNLFFNIDCIEYITYPNNHLILKNDSNNIRIELNDLLLKNYGIYKIITQIYKL